MSFVNNLLNIVANRTQTVSKVLKYTEKGAALVSKRAIASEELSQLANTFKLPSNITSGQYARVGQNFDASKNYTDILSFFDNDGNLVLRLQDIYKDSLNLSTTVKQFKYPKVWQWDKYNKLVEKTETTLQKDKVTKKAYEFQQIYKERNGVNTVAIGKVIREADSGNINHETQTAFQYSNKDYKKGYRLELEHNPNGENRIKNIETEGGIQVNPEDPYLSTYLYNRDDFAQSAYLHALKRNGINSPELAPKLDAKSQKLLKNQSRGEYSACEEEVRLHPLMNEKVEIVNNENHELYHHIEYCLQAQLLGILNGTPPKMQAYVQKYGRELSPEKLELAKAYDKNWKNYIRPEVDKKGYAEQIVERHAVNKGKEAVKEFTYHKNSLFDQMPYFSIN